MNQRQLIKLCPGSVQASSVQLARTEPFRVLSCESVIPCQVLTWAVVAVYLRMWVLV